MKSIRIRFINDKMIAIGIICDCGQNELKHLQSGDTRSHHVIYLNAKPSENHNIYECFCGNQYIAIQKESDIEIH